MEWVLGIIIFILGICIGSFLNVCIFRLPVNKSIVTSPSSCANCGHRLTTLDMVPVFSFIFLGGKCRHCGHKVSKLYPLVEALTGILFVLLYIKFDLGYLWLVYAALTSLLIVISFIDFEHMIIPNGLVLAGLVVGVIQLAVTIFTGIFGSWLQYAIGFFAGGVPLLLIELFCVYVFKKSAFGGGDIKLMAFAGLIIGWRLVITSYLIGIISGALISVFLLASGKKKRGDQIPFGPFLSLGIMISIFWGDTLMNWYLGLL